MHVLRAWCIIFVVVAACTCGARTECGDTAKMSFLTSVHDDLSCAKLSTKGVMLYEAARLFAEIYNNNTDEYEIEITVIDTCGSITGAIKAVMKALVWADINCLRPPHYLGIIGPNTATNAEAVHKVTSILKVPHIVNKLSISPYLHPLAEESNSYIVQGILKVIEILKWKSFMVANVDENDEDVQNIARQLTMSAAAKGLCVDEEDYTSRVVHIGKPEAKFFSRAVNATVLITSEGNLKDYLSRVNSTSTVLLLEDSSGKYDPEKLKEVRWLQAAVDVYTKALRVLCKNKKCKGEISPVDWNRVVSNVLAMYNAKSHATARFLDLSMKTKTGGLERLGSVIVRENKVKVYWGESELFEEEKEENGEENDEAANSEDVPRAFRVLLKRDDESQAKCVTAVKKIKVSREDIGTSRVLVSGMNDSEWWIVVCTVSSVGVAMFLVGIFAVYVIYANIRGPRGPKSKDRLDRDTSLRRVSSDGELPTAITTRHQRGSRTPQRTNSQRSDISEKSV